MTTEQTLATPVTPTEAVTEAPKAESAPITAPLLAGKFTSVEELEKSYKSLEKHIGEKRPIAPDTYVLPDETLSVIPEKVLTIAKNLNITQDQLKAITDELVENKRSQTEAAKKAAQDAMAKNQKELEHDFGPQLEERINGIKAVLNQYADEGTREALLKKEILHDAKLVKFLDKVATDVLKTKSIASDFAKRAITPSEAQSKINEKMANSEFRAAYYGLAHPNHKQAVAEMQQLFNIKGMHSG